MFPIVFLFVVLGRFHGGRQSLCIARTFRNSQRLRLHTHSRGGGGVPPNPRILAERGASDPTRILTGKLCDCRPSSAPCKVQLSYICGGKARKRWGGEVLYIYIYIYRKAFMKSEVNTGQSSDSKGLPAPRTSLGATGLRVSV